MIADLSFCQPPNPLIVKKGTYSFEIGSSNLFEYASSLGSQGTTNIHLFNWADPDSLLNIKYFFSDNRALRLRLGLTFHSHKFEENVQAFDDDLVAIPNELVTNTFISESFRIGVGVGVEHNYGHRKWRYFHGYEGFMSFQTGRNRIVNGNPLPLYLGTRLDDKTGVSVNLRAKLLAGLEYFIQHNTSLGVELGWGVSYTINAPGEYVIVEENEEGEAVEILKKGDNSSHSISLDNMLLANFKLAFYFNNP